MHCLIHVPELMNVKGIGGFENLCDLELLTSYLEEVDLIMTNHSTKRSSRSFKISRDHSTTRSSRAHHHFTSPLDPERSSNSITPLDCILDDKLQSLLHSALNQTLEHKEEKKIPAIHSSSHSTTLVEYSS
uniref:Uncharacterized protein At2g13400 n=1 Tax=Arabidopsis thaliana TaxID=3702 RepID=Q9SI40_ARATH|nr:hypothetical protein [Arabidopsis thaliana]